MHGIERRAQQDVAAQRGKCHMALRLSRLHGQLSKIRNVASHATMTE